MEEQKDSFNLQRFVDAQNNCDMWSIAMQELQRGRKETHWIWFVFPQLKGLGHSYYSMFYGISGLEEAKAYLEHDVLSSRLHAFCEELVNAQTKSDLVDVLGHIDYIKVRSCLTLFDAASSDDFFGNVLDTCYGGKRDFKTLGLLGIK